MTMTEVHCIGGGQVTEDQMRFFLSSATHDMIEEELSQLKHKVSQDTPTLPISEDRDNHIFSQTREEDDGPEFSPSSFNPSSVDDVVSDEIVDTVVNRESNHAISDQIDHTTAKYQEEKILVPVPRFTVVGKSVHFALQWSGDEVDRLTSSFNKKGLMSREDYNDLCSSIERIHGYLQKTVKSDNINEYAKGLEKLLNGGLITNDQAKAYKKQYNIGLNEDEAKAKVWFELNNPTFIKRNRPGESKRSKRVRAEKKKAREERIQREEEKRERARLATTGMKSSPVSSPPIRSYRLGKRNQKYVVIHNPVKSTPRTHNYRRKVQVAKQKVINHYKNKASPGVGRSSLNQPTNSNTRRSLKFKRRLYNKMCQSRKVIRPALVRYEESRREEIRFDETDADWNVLNEAIAIAKREAVELLRTTKEREDEEETAPSDTTKYDPVKAALDFLNNSSVDQNKHISISDNEESQPTLGLWNRGGNASSRKKSKRTIRQALYNQVLDICASCGKESNSSDMNTCNKCKSLKYCNAACKKKHRQKHKKQCERVGIDVGTSVDHVEQIRSQCYRRPVHPATLMTEELQFCRLCHIVALIGASNIKSKRRIKDMRRGMLLNIKIRPRRSRIAITSYYTAKVENILSKYMYNQRLRVQSALEERVRSDEEKGGDDTLDTLSCTSSSSNTEDSNDDIDAIDSKVSSSGYDNDSKKKTAPNQEEQAAPTTNVDISIPGAFTQYLHNSKRCCSDTGCSSVGTLSSSSSSGKEESSTQDDTQALEDTISSNGDCPNTALNTNGSVELMIGGGTTTTRRSKNFGKSAEEIRNEANKRRRDKRKNRSSIEAARANEDDRARKKTSRLSRSSKEEAEDKEKDRARKKTSRLSRSSKEEAEDKEKDRARKKTSRLSRSSKEEAEDKEKDRARKKTPQNRARHKARMRNTRARAKQKREDMSCSFEKTKVWEIPGNDYYNDADFESNPEVAVQLWHDNNGTWRERESKWLIAYLHIVHMMSEGDIEGPRPVLTELIRTSIECNRTLIEAVHLMFGVFEKDEWIAQRKWQEDECIEDSEMAALLWLDSPESNIDANLIQDTMSPKDLSSTPIVDEAWAKKLIGLKLQVPQNWWEDRKTKKRLKGTKLWECEIASIKLDDEKRCFNIKCLDDPDDPYCEERYLMAYEAIKEYADEKDPTYPSFEAVLPPFQRQATPFIDWEHVSLLKQTKESLVEAERDHVKLRDTLQEYCIDRITQIQEHQRLTPEKQHELGARFLKSQGRSVSWGETSFGESIDAPLYTCACCGYRDFDCDGCQYQDVNLDEGLDVLKLNEYEWKVHQDRIQVDDQNPLELPVDKDGNTKEFKTSKVYSIWPQDDELIRDLNQECRKAEGSRKYDDGLFECTKQHGKRAKLFHLHPEFVEKYTNDNKEFGFKAKMCSDCYRSITNKDKKTGEPKPMIPELSIANGIDFGDYKRVGLTPLTPRERHIISKVRHCINIIKIEGNSGANKHSTIKGCGIIFDHDSPQVVRNLLTPESINGDVQLQFVDHKGEYDRLIAKAIRSAYVSGRAYVIYQWLEVLRRINKWYEDDTALPPFNEFKQTVEDCNNELIKQATLTGNKNLEKQVNIRRDDYAAIRAITPSNTARVNDNNEGESDGDDLPMPMRHVYLTDSEKTAYDNRADLDNNFVHACATTLKVDVKDGQAQYEHDAAQKQQTKSFRGEEPLNEFLTGDESLVKAHADVFLLGTAYDSYHKAPRLTTKQRKHLLMQFNCAAASCVPLIFHLFDQMQRHEVVKAVHAKTQDKEKFDAFVKMFTSDEFQDKLQKALVDPHGPVGREVIRKLSPMLASVGRSVTFGALERDRSKGEILALGRRFGCAPSFLTFAIDDVNSATSIRLVTPSSNNNEFPSRVSGETYEALRNGFDVDGHIPIPKTYLQRLARLTENPVGAALLYKKFVEDVLTILIGGKSTSSRRTSFVLDNDSNGIFGTNIAYFGKTETTGRGSLHFHVVLWGGISPDFLELMADIPELCKRVGSVLESMYSATLTKEQHVADLVKKETDELCSYEDDTKPTYRTLPPRAMQISPDPLDMSRFEDHVCTTVCKFGIHQHTYTCYKGTMGYTGCRLCKPSGLRKETLPVILEADEDNEDDKSAYKNPPSETITPLHKLDGVRSSSQNLFPIPSSDPRTIVWEMKRPPLEPLPSPKDDTTREEILQKLYQQMMSQSVNDGVIYDPPMDENCLFHVLLKGLKRARPSIAEGMTTKSLRAELMKYLELHKDKVVKADVDIEVDSVDATTLNDLAEDQRNARDNIQHMEFDIQEYLKEMKKDTPYKCKRGGCLEYYLFAKKYDVNVAIHHTYGRKSEYINKKNDLQYGVRVGDDSKPTIHLYYHNEHYKLLRYEWPWSWFETVTTHKSSCDGFEEHHKMWLSSQVDLYDFVQDNNNLFHNLMQGLVIVGASKPSNPIKSSQLTLRGMKRDLMQHLKDCPHKTFKDYKKTGKVTSLEDEVIRRLSVDDETHNIESQSPIERYAQLIQDEERGGDELEMYLFAKSKNVNVILYEQVREDIFEWRHEFEATSKDSAETIHLLRHKSRDDNSRVYYTLFMPKLYSIMKALQAVDDTTTLKKMYDKISTTIQDRNGLVVDYNPLLTALLGCNTNLLFLGSKEQSRGALFYIGPYINKNGVEIIDALPLIVDAQNKALTYLSVAEDRGTDKRTVQHTLQKTLNKLNSKMEVSDTQAAGALLDLDARITDEIFSYYDAKGYKNFVLDTFVHGLHQNFEPRGNIEDLGECDTDDEAEFSADESCDGDESIEETAERLDCDKDDVPDDVWKSFEDDCCDKFDMRHDKGAYGHAKIYNMGNDDLTGSVESHAVSYPELYRYRGPDLKHLNRLEYCALVKVGINKEKDEDEDEATPGRKPNKKYQFGSGLKETIGSKYCQILRSKQCTPKFFCKLPPPPGKKPANPSKARRWKKKADTFAFHYLTMFRPETKFYDLSIDCNFDYKYDYETFLEFESSLRCSDRAIDHSRLELMERYIHGWKVNTAKRMMLAKYRGRNRTEWSKEQQQMAREYKTKAMENHSDVFDYDCQFKTTELSSGQKKKNEKIDTHKRECVSILQDCASGALECHHKAKSNRKLPRIPLNKDSYMSLKEAKPALDNKPTVQKCCPVPRNIVRQVDKYLKKQDLSTDKDQAVQILRDHFTAMHEGRSEADDYEAPYLLICGGPGNGKSKLVETFDGMSKCMDVGRLVKTAFVGGAAVNINGSSLLGLFDIPVIDKGDGTEETKKKRIIPWSSDKRRSFLDRYDLDRISCIIVDEISTVKPYMLSYLNARLMELYRDSGKPFGGRAVVLLGDFDQLPPVGGDSLAGAAMKYEEAVCKKEASSADDCEDLTAFLSGHFDSKKCFDLKTAGILLFQRVKHIKLTEQHRSKDPEHTELLQKMSSQGRLHPRHLKLYKDLSEEDMKDEDGEFAFATMVVTGNAERHELNALQAKRWASRHNTKVVRWLRKRDGKNWKGKPRNQNHEAMAMQEDCFYEMFVPGAAGYITENINTDIGLANGVEIKYHSLSFESEEEDMIFNEEFEADGSLVMTLDRPPDAINVELFADFDGDSEDKKQENKRKRKDWTHGSLVNDGRVVVQLSRQWGSELIRKWKDESIAGSWRFGYNVSTLPMKDHFPIEPAFSVTIYKAQGRTIRRLIIFVSQHPIPLLRMSWEGLYVALSRVKYRDHIRLAIKRNDHGRHSLQYMENLRKNKYTAWFFSGFKPIGASQVMTWNRKAAWKAADFDKLAKDMSKVKKTPNKARKKRTRLDVQKIVDIQNARKSKKCRKM